MPANSSAASQRPKTIATARPTRHIRLRRRPVGSSRVVEPPPGETAPPRRSETRKVSTDEFMSMPSAGPRGL
jgi:hypothetical protein